MSTATRTLRRIQHEECFDEGDVQQDEVRYMLDETIAHY